MRVFHGLAASLAALAFVVAAPAAHALTINLVDQGGVTGSAAEKGFRVAAAYWSNVITNDVTVNFGVSYASLAANVIGSTSSTETTTSVSNWEAMLAANPNKSQLDRTAVLPTLNNGAAAFVTSAPKMTNSSTPTCSSSLPSCGVNVSSQVYDQDVVGPEATNNRNLVLTSSNAKAIGLLVNPSLDATIQFSSNFSFDFDPSDGISGNAIDFIATAIHEMGHALGFVSGVDTYSYASNGTTYNGVDLNRSAQFTTLDMFRYSNGTDICPAGSTSCTAAPVLDEAVGVASYLSIDGGVSQLAGNSLFSTGVYGGDGQQASHWKDSPGCGPQLGILDPTECYGQEGVVTALDLAAFDAIGYNLDLDVLQQSGYTASTASIYAMYGAVPEPSGWMLMGVGFGFVGSAIRRRDRIVFKPAIA